VKKGAPFKGSQPKGNASGKPRGTCFNCNEVGHYSKDCPKLKLGNGASKVIALTSNLGQGECNRFIFLKGKLSKREVLCLLDTGASHNFITQESAQRMGLPFGGAQGTHRGALCEWDSPSYQVPSKRCAPPIGELERQGGLVNFHFRGNGLHFGNGIHHTKQCVHRRAQ
jgi:hypothetical protein